MDTTAAAELGGMMDGGNMWGAGGGEQEGLSGAEKQQQQQGWGGRSGPPNMEGPNPPKRMRTMNGAGDGFGPGPGNFNNGPPFGPGFSDPGLRPGYGPGGGPGGNPNATNNFPIGAPNPGFPQGPPPPPLPPGTPGGDQSGQGQAFPSRGRGTGSIFYKTKLCSRFRNGNCPYSTNCNFAHGMDELRRPPPGWEDVAGPQEGGMNVAGVGSAGGNGGGVGSGGGGNGGGGGRGSGQAGGGNVNAAPAHPPAQSPGPNPGLNQGTTQGSNQGPSTGPVPIPNPVQNQASNQAPNQGQNQGPNPGPNQGGPSNDPLQRFHKTRPCKKYFSELGCPYGDRCNFLHDEPNPQSQPCKSGRESVVVTVVTNGGGPGSGPGPAASAGGGGSGGGLNQRPPNWKTRLCNKWETTGNCPFGEKCHFAHGTTELQRYGGGPIDPSSVEAGTTAQADSRFGTNSSGNSAGDGDEGRPDTNPQAGNIRQTSSHPQQQTSRPNSGTGSKSPAVWKGPTTLSRIYGDWLDEFDWPQVTEQK